MELRQLKYFVTVAEELNFRRAAERLYMEQPPLSRQIRQLEDELGVELFYRSKRGVTLTEAGNALLDEARLTLAQAERAAKAAQQAVQAKKLTIGFSICAFNRVLPELIQVFRQRFPEVVVTLTEMSAEAQIQALLNNTIDFGFVHGPVAHSDLHSLTLLSEPVVVALPADHALVEQTQIDLHLLADESFVLCPQPVKPELYAQIMQLCDQAGFRPRIVQEASPPEVLLGLVESGMGITLVAAGAGTRHNLGVVYRPLATSTPLATPQVEIAVVWHKGQTSPIAHQFLSLINRSV
ncbi:LysR family transcriptional regulator [Leptolyngbya sp. FACHB-261]|uniref:LysR family transcriptional regulator n=1 Tax=Leptolyngbya sp. FACHB-261 TaxID=2692806 RepID=UPI0016849A32|nr:LysR family transcriptional regulator [Leptolyngbya sp. FACHB-261]MBD2102823.1 LysR family transcriptional regulator [Leptolyngbya sp. FACHB-261]